MNGVHDMGGMQGFGPVVPEKNEPVFHEAWEGRLVAMRRAVAATGKLPPLLRPAIESIPPADYLRLSYYEKWYLAVVELLVAGGLATREEIARGKAAAGSVKSVPITPEAASVLPFRLAKMLDKTAVKPGYSVGERVRARKINPVGHTRLPRYARGRTGVIEIDRGVQNFPDTSVYGRGDHPQHVYAVRFAARELWGEAASARDSVYLDLWESYLERG
jgi:nitrile hydratase subunit beta